MYHINNYQSDVKRIGTKGVTLVLIAGTVAGLLGVSQFTSASSHREAPMISGDPKADATDLFAFVSPDNAKTATIIANYLPFQEPGGGPNFYSFDDNVLYEIKIDNDGDAKEDIAYQFRFTTTINNKNTFLYNTGAITALNDPDFNVRQKYTVTKVAYDDKGKSKSIVIGDNVPVPPSNVGPKSTPDYKKLQDMAITPLSSGGKVFAGQSDDPFFVDLGGLFDLLTIRKLPGNDGGGVDGLKGYNVQSIAIQVPITELSKDGKVPTQVEADNAVVGVWTTSSRQAMNVLRNAKDKDPKHNKDKGDWVQVSRLGAPLVNEVVIPLGDKDVWNASKPSDDAQFAQYVANPELGNLLKALYNIQVPPQGAFGTDKQRDDLIAIFLTGIPGLTKTATVTPSEQLRLNLAVAPTVTPNSLGVVAGDNQGYPNGRRLADDVTDISIKAVAGAAYPLFHPEFNADPLAAQLGDGVDKNDAEFRTTFPYLALPWSGFESVPHQQ
ncbi:MAG: DUF4331 domain-containing protein [Patescibacteria group bacterium]